LKRQVSPAIIAAAVVVLVIVLGVFFYRQVLYTEPTPRPNRGVSMDTTSPNTSGPANPGK